MKALPPGNAITERGMEMSNSRDTKTNKDRTNETPVTNSIVDLPKRKLKTFNKVLKGK